MTRSAAVPSLALAGLLAALVACAGGNRPASEGPGSQGAEAAPPDTIEGTVRRVGSTPFVRTVVDAGERALRVVGPLEAELRRLAGARVRATGERADDEEPGEALRVGEYRILAVDGAEPEVGVLRASDGGGYHLETEAGDRVPLAGVPEGLRRRVGAKVWIVTGRGGAVQMYGILREAGEGEGEGGSQPGRPG